MIDTDKYEGHTEGSWRAFEDIEGADTNTPYRTGAWTVGNAVSKSSAPPLHFDDEHDPHTYNVMGICLLHSINQNNEANAKLIADAPLLLAEVKRLQKLEAAVVGSWLLDNDGYFHEDKIIGLLAEGKRLQERLDWILGDEELAGYVWEKEVAYMEWEGVRLPWISADEWGEEE